MYDFYEEPYNARVLIDSVYTFGDASKNGIYTFRVCYQPHYPEKCVVVLNSNAYCLENEGFAYPTGVVEEVCSIIKSTKCDNKTMMEILKGVYLYIYEQSNQLQHLLKNQHRPEQIHVSDVQHPFLLTAGQPQEPVFRIPA